jgi:hypothetical protein
MAAAGSGQDGGRPTVRFHINPRLLAGRHDRSVAKYRSLMPSLALIGHLIDGVAGGPTGPVSGGTAARAVAWCEYLQGHARRLYASVTDQARVAAALLAAQLTHGRLPSPFTARDVYRNEWTGLTEPRVVQGALACLAELGWLRSDAV